MSVSEKPFLGSVPVQPASSAHEIQPQPESVHPEGIQRLSIAIINRAVLDLLENGRYSSAAERWLLSPEFDRIHNLLS